MTLHSFSTLFLASTAMATLSLVKAGAAMPERQTSVIILAQAQPSGPGRASPGESDPADPRLRRPRPRDGDAEATGERQPGPARSRGPNAAQPDEPGRRRPAGASPAASDQPDAVPPRQTAPAGGPPAARPGPPAARQPDSEPAERAAPPARRPPAATTSPPASATTIPPQEAPARRPPAEAPVARPGGATPPSSTPLAPAPAAPATAAPPSASTPSAPPGTPAARPQQGTPSPGTAASGEQEQRERQRRRDQGPAATPGAPRAPVAPGAPTAAPATAPIAPPATPTPPPPATTTQPRTPPAAVPTPLPPATATQPRTPPQIPGAAPIGRAAPAPDRLAPGVAPERLAPGIATGGDVRIEELRTLRRERVEDNGRRVIIEEPGNRVIIRENGREFIRHDETERFRRAYDNADVRVERRGEEQITIVRRPNGFEVITVRDADGNLIRRVRRDPRGTETVLIENVIAGRPRTRTVIEEVVDLPPPRLTIPREKYVVEVERASQDDIYEAFTAPPIERVERRYSLDQVRQSQTLRERVRRVDVDTVTFEFGSWQLSEDQIGALTGVAEAIRRALSRNPDEIFLIEGHTDAVGSEVDNLTLSDRRAETVATILTERFGVAAENLTTQGYGEQYLKVNTQEPAQENRRVTIRNITPLLREHAAR